MTAAQLALWPAPTGPRCATCGNHVPATRAWFVEVGSHGAGAIVWVCGHCETQPAQRLGIYELRFVAPVERAEA